MTELYAKQTASRLREAVLLYSQEIIATAH